MFKLVLNTDEGAVDIYDIAAADDLERAALELAEAVEAGGDIYELLENGEFYDMIYDFDELIEELAEPMKRQKLDTGDALVLFEVVNVEMYVALNYNQQFQDLSVEVLEIYFKE